VERSARGVRYWKTLGEASGRQPALPEVPAGWGIETHSRGTLAVNGDRAGDLIESLFADHGIVAELLDVQETSVGVVADLP